jgi:hypothetical protein
VQALFKAMYLYWTSFLGLMQKQAGDQEFVCQTCHKLDFKSTTMEVFANGWIFSKIFLKALIILFYSAFSSQAKELYV